MSRLQEPSAIVDGDPAQAAAAPAPAPAPAGTCPGCGAALQPDQDWCLECGWAARSRLAGTPDWRRPLLVLAALIAIALAVLAVALVKLAG